MQERSQDWRPCYDAPTPASWNGHPVELGDAWTLRKGDKVARCVLVSHSSDGSCG